jgi:hypothetical protein
LPVRTSKAFFLARESFRAHACAGFVGRAAFGYHEYPKRTDRMF